MPLPLPRRAGAGTALALALLLVNWELRALAENVEVEFDDAVRHLAVEQKAVFRNGITLVVNFNGHIAVNVEVVRLLHTLYAAVFHQVVFTGQQRPEGLDSVVRWTNCEEPWMFFHMCLAYAMVEYPESSTGGYLFLGDDTMIDPCRLASLNESKFWINKFDLHAYKGGEREGPHWIWWANGVSKDALNTSEALDRALETMPQPYKQRFPHAVDQDTGAFAYGHTMIDWLHVPKDAIADFIHLANHFRRHDVMLEAAVPQIVFLLAGPDGWESPPSFNYIDINPGVEMPEKGVSDEDAPELLRQGQGITLPASWIVPDVPRTTDWARTPLYFMHPFKLSHFFRRHVFMAWWLSLPCLQ